MPAWNWQLMPGVATLPLPLPAPGACWLTGGMGTRSFVGGASDGVSGTTAFDFVAAYQQGIAYRRTVAFGADRYVAVFADITASDAGRPVFVTAAQHMPAGPVYGSGSSGQGPSPLPVGNGTAPPGTWWLHDGQTGIVWPQLAPGSNSGVDAQLWVTNAVVTGNWSTIGAESGMVSPQMFVAWMSVAAPVSNVSVVYVVMPNITLEGMVQQAPIVLADTVVSRQDGTAAVVTLVTAATVHAVVYGCDSGDEGAGISGGSGGGGCVTQLPSPVVSTLVDAEGAYIFSLAATSLALTVANPNQTSWAPTVAVTAGFTLHSCDGGGSPVANATANSVTFTAAPADGTSVTAWCNGVAV